MCNNLRTFLYFRTNNNTGGENPMRRLLSLFLAFMVCMTAFSASSFVVEDNAHSHYDDCTVV